MLVETRDLPQHSGKVAMVDGGFDPIHPGHIAYFRAAEQLGLPVLCNVSSDDWVGRKHPVLLTQRERGEVLDAIRHVAFVHLSATSTADVLRTLRPRYYVKGADWRGRLPEEEVALCRDLGIDLVFLDTVTHSSSELLRRHGGG